VEEFRSLSGEELSLCEFLLNQILLLRESLEPCLVPRVVEELLGTKLVAPYLAQDTPCPPAVVGKVAEGKLVAASRVRTLLVLRLWWARWWRGVQWSSAPLPFVRECLGGGP
jgi:hypothetical protein